MSPRWIAVAGAGVVVIAVSAFIEFRAQHADRPKTLPPVQAAAPLPPSEIVLSGKIQATKVVNVGAPIEGTIEQLLVGVGEDVTEGEVLARVKNLKGESAQEKMQLEVERAQNHVAALETAVLNARLEVSRAEADVTRSKMEFERAEKEYAKQQMMLREGVTPRLTFEKAEQDYKRLKVELDSEADGATNAAERLKALTSELAAARKTFAERQTALEGAQGDTVSGEVYAPSDGVVVGRRAQQGEAVTPKVADLFQIAVDLTALEVIASPLAQDMQRIHTGDVVAVEIKDVPGTIQGKVREIKSGQVTVEFTSPSPAIRPGITATIKVH